MEKQHITIGSIPAILWGPASNKLFIAVHGDQSHKGDDAILVFAEEAANKGYQMLSFDLPEHGDRKDESRLCSVQNCIEDLRAVMAYVRTISENIGLFGCSVGAYFGIQAFKDEPISQALFLSPVVDMKRQIENMMTWFDITPERLKREGIISTPMKTLYWDYYEYVTQHPVEWDKPTAILYGKRDEICEFDCVKRFAELARADLTVWAEGEHYFHTEAQLAFLRSWGQEYLERCS